MWLREGDTVKVYMNHIQQEIASDIGEYVFSKVIGFKNKKPILVPINEEPTDYTGIHFRELKDVEFKRLSTDDIKQREVKRFEP